MGRAQMIPDQLRREVRAPASMDSSVLEIWERNSGRPILPAADSTLGVHDLNRGAEPRRAEGAPMGAR